MRRPAQKWCARGVRRDASRIGTRLLSETNRRTNDVEPAAVHQTGELADRNQHGRIPARAAAGRVPTFPEHVFARLFRINAALRGAAWLGVAVDHLRSDSFRILALVRKHAGPVDVWFCRRASLGKPALS